MDTGATVPVSTHEEHFAVLTLDRICAILEASEAFLSAKSDYESADRATQSILLKTLLHTERNLVEALRRSGIQAVAISLRPLDQSIIGPHAICLFGRAEVLLSDDEGTIRIISLHP